MKRAVVLLSGGLDSATCLYWAKAKGYRIDIEGPDHTFRQNVYFLDPAGFQFEFVQYLSDDPKQRNRYDTPATMKVGAA